MRTSTAGNRLPVLAVVVGAHALALAWLLPFTGNHPMPGTPDVTPLLVLLLPSVAPPQPLLPDRPVPAPPGDARRPASSPAPPPPAAAPESASPAAIDWAAQAQDAASRWVAQDEKARRRARAFGFPPAGALFAPPYVPRLGIPWRQARVQAEPGGVTVIQVNDHCVIAFLWIVPMFGCQIGKIPVRGDLFEHLHEGD